VEKEKAQAAEQAKVSGLHQLASAFIFIKNILGEPLKGKTLKIVCLS